METTQENLFGTAVKRVLEMLLTGNSSLSSSSLFADQINNANIKQLTNCGCISSETAQDNVFDRMFFTLEYSLSVQAIQAALSAFIGLLKFDPEFIALRINTESLSTNKDSFVIASSAAPMDQIIYTSPVDIVDLNIRDGGLF